MNMTKTGRPRAKRRPSSKLAAWMRANDCSVRDMADRLDVAASTVYALRDRTLKPGLDLALRVEDATGIPVAYWTRG